MKYEQVFENYCRIAESIFYSRGLVVGYIFIFGKDGSVNVVAMKGDKKAVEVLSNMLIRATKAEAVIVVSEAWNRIVQPEEVGNYEGPVSEDPLREEILMVTLETDEGSMAKVWSIETIDGKRVLKSPKAERNWVGSHRWTGGWFKRNVPNA